MSHPKQIDARAVVQAAMSILQTSGADGLSLRAVAASLKVKAPSLYRYFADKAALEDALVEQGNRLLLEAIRPASKQSEPETALRMMAKAYLRFARNRPALYFFIMDGKRMSRGSSANGKEVWNLVLSAVASLSRESDATSHTVALWAFLHGFAALDHSGSFGQSGPKTGFEVGLEAFLMKFRSST